MTNHADLPDASPAQRWWTRFQGGPLGRRASGDGPLRTVGPWAMAAFAISWLVLMARQLPCREGVQPYGALCYTDITTLYYARGLRDGQIPYLDSALEYPVLTGGLVELARRITMLLGGQSRPGLSDEDVRTASEIFFGVNTMLLFALFAVLVATHLRLSRPQDALMVAAAPAITTAGLINWDGLVVALTSLALLAWARGRPGWTGVLIGLGVAAKLYPAFLLLPLGVLCLRAGRWRAFFTTVATAVVAWLVVDVPVYLANPANWLYFWEFNATGRGADLGSIWYVLQLMNHPVPDVSMTWKLALVVGYLAIAALLLVAPVRPRLAQGAFLVVAWFLVVNVVYSPQYVLWLLPLLVLARPRWVDWAVFSAAEAFYYVFIWYFLDGSINAPGTDQARLYWVAVFVRVGVQLWLCARVVADLWRPQRDIVRRGGLDDPDGGLLDGRPDASWLARLRTGGPQ